MQAAAIAVAFILLGKLAELLITRIIAKVVRRSSSQLDDSVIDLLHRPIFEAFVLIGVAYGSDIDQVIDTLSGVAASHEEACEKPEPRVRFREFGESSLNFELLCWIDQPVDRGRMLHELNCAVYKAFAAEGMTIPFPQRD